MENLTKEEIVHRVRLRVIMNELDNARSGLGWTETVGNDDNLIKFYGTEEEIKAYFK